MSIILTIKKTISLFLACVMMLLFPAGPAEQYSAINEDRLIADFTVLSDTHIEGNNYDTYKTFRRLLNGVKANKNGTDALVFLGDNTMNGQDIESMFFYGTLDRVKPANNIFVVQGNHDVGNGEGDYEQLRDRFLDYNNIFFDAGLTKAYYHRIVKGCYLIFLASESDTVNDAYISDEQLEWLRDILAEAQEAGSPIFVFNHHPIYAVQDDSMKLVRELQGIDNLLYIFGHTHWAINDTWTIYEEYGIQSINLPRCIDDGIGLQIEVYEDEVVVRIRDYYDDFWVEGYEKTYELK